MHFLFSTIKNGSDCRRAWRRNNEIQDGEDGVQTAYSILRLKGVPLGEDVVSMERNFFGQLFVQGVTKKTAKKFLSIDASRPTI